MTAHRPRPGRPDEHARQVTTGFRDMQWGEWHGAGGWLNAMMPSVPAVGNHEYYGGPEGAVLTPHGRAQYALPEHGPEGLVEQNYYIDYQGVRIICLNSVDAEAKPKPGAPDTSAAPQAAWLEKVLQNNPQKWTMVAFHYPVFSAWSPTPPV